jgi:hypothetical protein
MLWLASVILLCEREAGILKTNTNSASNFHISWPLPLIRYGSSTPDQMANSRLEQLTDAPIRFWRPSSCSVLPAVSSSHILLPIRLMPFALPNQLIDMRK